MTNLEAAVAVLAAHREARQWTDEAVAADLVAQLGLDPAGNAAKATPVVPPGITEDEVVAHETAAKEATAKAKAARDTLNAQKAEASAANKPAAPATAAGMSLSPGADVARRQQDALQAQRDRDAAAQRTAQNPAAMPTPPAPAQPRP